MEELKLSEEEISLSQDESGNEEKLDSIEEEEGEKEWGLK